MVPTYRRLRDKDRMLPDGVTFHGSWVEPSFARCFQLMACDDLAKLQAWALQWRGCGVTFEMIPVVPAAETRALVAPFLAEP
jgi:hypothetical protein